MKRLFSKQMAAIVVGLLVCVCGAGTAKALVTPENMYDLGTIHTFYLQMDPCDFQEMRFTAGDNYNETPGQVLPNPATGQYDWWQGWLGQSPIDDPDDPNDFIEVAIRRKSGIALPSEADPQKIAIKVDISKPGYTPPAQRFGGKKKLSLENGCDSSLITEGLAWRIYQAAGVVASRANWVKVYLSTDLGETWNYMGLYINVEQIDEEFLEDHMPNRHDYGFLYQRTENLGEIKETRAGEANPFRFKWYPFDHPTDVSETSAPSDWVAQTPERVDMDQLLKFGAVEDFISNQDGTINKGNNFYYYDWATNPTDPNLMDPDYKQPRMYFPWDLDTCMTGATTTPIIDDRGGSFVRGLILEQQKNGTPLGYHTFQADYYSTYKSLIDGPLTTANLQALISSIQAAISAEVAADPYAGVSASEEFSRLNSYVAARRTFVNGQLSALVPSTLPWSNGFESGDFIGGGWTALNSNTTVATAAKYTGAYGAKLAGTTSMQKLIDTTGFTGITVQYRRQTNNFDSGENIYVEWSTDGVNWNNLETIQTATWAQGLQSRTCASGANDNANFQIRFRTNANQSSQEYAYVDDVSVSGTVATRTLTASSTAGGDVTTPGEGAYGYGHGSAADIVATPDTGYHFINWTGTAVAAGKVANPESASTTVTMDADYTTVANFAIDTFTLTYAAGTHGTLTGETAQVVDYGTNGTAVTAVPDTGYHFVNWSDASTDNPRTDLSVTANISVTANFAIDTFTLDYGAGAGGSLTGETSQVVDYGTNGTAVTAVADTGYHFVNWSDASTGNPRTDLNVTANISVTANFAIDQMFIFGRVTEPDANVPVEGVVMDANNGGGSDVTDANGCYELMVDYGWSGTLVPSKTGYTFEPNSVAYDNAVTDQNDSFVAILDTFTISGYAVDSQMYALEGVLVTPENDGGPFTSKYYGGSYTTGADGFYQVRVDYNWCGKVVPSKYAYAFEPNSISYSNVTENKSAEQYYVGTLLTYTITGHIKNAFDAPIAGVTVNADNGGGSDITDANGMYEVWVDYNWSGTVTPTKAHYTFDPGASGYVNVLYHLTDQNYIASNIFDLYADGSIDGSDLAVFCANWLTAAPECDFLNDGMVNSEDFAEFASAWHNE